MKEFSKGKFDFILHVMIRGMLSSPLMQLEIIICGLVRKWVIFDNICKRFSFKLYKKKPVDIPIGNNSASLVADLCYVVYERDFMLSLSYDFQSEVIETFDSTSRYLDGLLNIYLSELQLKKPAFHIPMPHFWIYIYLYRMFRLRLRFMRNEEILI